MSLMAVDILNTFPSKPLVREQEMRKDASYLYGWWVNSALPEPLVMAWNLNLDGHRECKLVLRHQLCKKQMYNITKAETKAIRTYCPKPVIRYLLNNYY